MMSMVVMPTICGMGHTRAIYACCECSRIKSKLIESGAYFKDSAEHLVCRKCGELWHVCIDRRCEFSAEIITARGFTGPLYNSFRFEGIRMILSPMPTDSIASERPMTDRLLEDIADKTQARQKLGDPDKQIEMLLGEVKRLKRIIITHEQSLAQLLDQLRAAK